MFAKPDSTSRQLAISPHKNWTTGRGLTGVGLIACIVKDEYGGNTLDVGPIILGDKGKWYLQYKRYTTAAKVKVKGKGNVSGVEIGGGVELAKSN